MSIITPEYQTAKYSLHIEKTKHSSDYIKCAAYKKNDNRYFYVEYKGLLNVFNSIGKEFIFNTKIECVGADNFECVVKQIQYHPVTEKILHFELYILDKDNIKYLVLSVPITLSNTKHHAVSIETGKPVIQVLKNVDIITKGIFYKSIDINLRDNTEKKYRIQHLLEDSGLLIKTIDPLYTIAKIK